MGPERITEMPDAMCRVVFVSDPVSLRRCVAYYMSRVSGSEDTPACMITGGHRHASQWPCPGPSIRGEDRQSRTEEDALGMPEGATSYGQSELTKWNNQAIC